MESSRRITEEALKLDPVERAELIEALLASFDPPARAEIDALWAAEVEARLTAHESGALDTSPAVDVFTRLGS